MGQRKRSKQQSFVFRSVGGRRAGAGRKPRPENVGLLPHCARPRFDAKVPVHVTMRAVRGVPSLRKEVVARLVIDEIRRASAKGFRVLHFSVQHDHVHLIAEGDDGTALSRGMQRVASRIAMGINALARRRGMFWRERYHRRDLGSPRQFRNALVYVTHNFRKHAPPGHQDQREALERQEQLDPLSSARWFTGWATEKALVMAITARIGTGPPPVVEPRTWVARTGWKRLGRIDLRESPRTPQ